MIFRSGGTGLSAAALDAASVFAPGSIVVVKDGTGTAAATAISVSPHGTDTIDGANAAVTITANWGVLRFWRASSTSWLLW